MQNPCRMAWTRVYKILIHIRPRFMHLPHSHLAIYAGVIVATIEKANMLCTGEIDKRMFHHHEHTTDFTQCTVKVLWGRSSWLDLLACSQFLAWSSFISKRSFLPEPQNAHACINWWIHCPVPGFFLVMMEEQSLCRLGALVIDELHMLSDPNR